MKRKAYIDFLKVIGLIGIILAHVDSPQFIMMLRSFDVPLMVLLSAILAKHTFPKGKLSVRNTCTYIIRRVKRLVIPTWIFLAGVFILFALNGTTFSKKYYILSFLLTRYGFSYVWIVLVYLYCAIMVPFFSKLKYGKRLWMAAFAVYLMYEVMYYLKIGTENRLIMSTFYYIIPYGILTLLGFCYDEMSRRVKINICLISGCLFIVLAAFFMIQAKEFQLVQIAKYPPRLYYLSYAIVVSFGMLLLCEGRENKVFSSSFIRFFSRYSFGIYLWHILYLIIADKLLKRDNWILEFILVTGCSVISIWLQNRAIDVFERKTGKLIPKYLRG